MNNLTQFFNQAPTQISLSILVMDIILSGICAIILAWFYNRYGHSLSNRRRFARNFLIISVTTTLIITVVKSSLALSLGLVGALSIVRFRSAIKEPEELAYLFLAIAIGLGFGANQHAVTLVAFFLILIMLYFQNRKKQTIPKQNLYLNIDSPRASKSLDYEAALQLIKPYCTKIDLVRVDQSKEKTEIACYIEFNSQEDVNQILKTLKKASPQTNVTLIDQSGIVV